MLQPQSYPLLDDVILILIQHPDLVVQVEGHTDSEPISGREFNSNWELGFAWALTVHRALAAHGANHAGVTSYADGAPIEDNGTPEGHKANRRVEFVLLPEPGVASRFDPNDTQGTPDEGAAPPEEQQTPDD